MGLDSVVAKTLIAASHPISFFLIVSGYGLYHVHCKGGLSYRYLLKRTVRLYLAFWLILLVFVIGIGNILYPEKFVFSIKIIVKEIV